MLLEVNEREGLCAKRVQELLIKVMSVGEPVESPLKDRNKRKCVFSGRISSPLQIWQVMNGLDVLKQLQQGNRDNKGQCVQWALSIKWDEGRRDGSVSCRDRGNENKRETEVDEKWQYGTTFTSEVWFDGKITGSIVCIHAAFSTSHVCLYVKQLMKNMGITK